MEREFHPRPMSYTPFVTMLEDTDHTIADTRRHLLQQCRFDLSQEIHQKPAFTTSLDTITESFSQEPNAPLSLFKNDIPDLVNRSLNVTNGTELTESLRLKEIGEIFFNLGRVAGPFYLHFAKELEKFASEQGIQENRTYLFCGRDSFPFLLAAKRLQEITHRQNASEKTPIHYAPFNRLSFQRLFSGPEGETAFKQDLAKFYKEHELTGKQVIAIDFGFIGSLERISQLVLDESEKPETLHHFLFTTFQKTRPPWFLDNLGAMGYDITADEAHVANNIHGYLNRMMQHHPEDTTLREIYNNGIPETSDWKPYLNPFMLFLQEMGAGINESRQDCLNEGQERAYRGNHLKFASAQQLVGLCAYLQGVSESLKEKKSTVTDDEGLAALKTVFTLFRDHQAFFQEYIPQEDRRHLQTIPVSPLFEDISRKLAELRTLPISTVKFSS